MPGTRMRGLAALVVTALVVTALAVMPVMAQQAPQPLDRSPVELRVMTFNIWVGGEFVDFGRVIEAIELADADVVGLQEPTGNIHRIADALGWQYVDERMHVISRFPLIDPPGANGDYILVQTGVGAVVALMNVHLTSSDYGPYLLRDGMPLDDVLDVERANRLAGLEPFIARAPELLAQDIPVILTGDFNTPSHLDWTAAAAEAGLFLREVAWPVTVAAEDAGFVDTYRVIHPDPVARPGITWTYGYPYPRLNDGEMLDRIDLVLAAGDVEVLDSQIVGPAGSPDVDIPVTVYPSDHRAVVSTMRVTPAEPPLFVAVEDRIVEQGDLIVARYHAPTGENDDRLYLVAAGDTPNPEGSVWMPPIEASYFGAVTFATHTLTPGSYEIVLADGAGAEVARSPFTVVERGALPSLAVSAETVAQGDDITVTWDNAPGMRFDWLGIYSADNGDLYSGYWAFAYTGASAAGEYTFTSDDLGAEMLPPGDYIARLMLDDGYLVLAEASFTVTE